MNNEQNRVDHAVGYQIKFTGLSEFRRHALQRLKLKTVIKESHCSQVQHLATNLCSARCRNLFATVARNQATIYDDLHLGEHVAVVSNMALADDVKPTKDTFHSCCWINTDGLSQHPYGDALLAVGGSDTFIHIISVAEAAVVAQLPVPASTSVADLSAAAKLPGMLLVLFRDGTLQLWQVATGQCCLSIKTDAFTAALHPNCHYVVTSSRSRKLSLWDLQPVVGPAAAAAAAGYDTAKAARGKVTIATERTTAAAAVDAVVQQLLLVHDEGGCVVDCMKFLTGDRLATKTTEGLMAIYHMPVGGLLTTWKVPGYSSSTCSASYSSRCCFSHTQDGQYICVGNQNATAFVYDTTTGCQLAKVEAIRVQGTVKACGVSEDCRHLVMAVGSGYIFRFEYRLTAAGEAQPTRA